MNLNTYQLPSDIKAVSLLSQRKNSITLLFFVMDDSIAIEIGQIGASESPS
jgi:hypothetical protein